MAARILFTISILFLTHTSFAEPTFTEPTLDQIRQDLDLAIHKLDKINYLPDLLPIIINNEDFIGLTQKQVDELEDWRKSNRAPTFATMNKIASKRIRMKQAALSPTVSSARLLQMQNEIFRLQREVIEYKLSCRESIIKTFNNENWISLFLVLADEDIGITVPQNYADAQRLQQYGEIR